MRAIGFRVEPKLVNWVVVDYTPLIRVAHGKLPAPKVYEEAESLGWYRKEVLNLIAQYSPNKVAVRYQETNFPIKNKVSTFARLRIEGVILEAADSKGLEVLTCVNSTISSLIGSDSAKGYVNTGNFRGLDLSGLSEECQHAFLAAAAALGVKNVRDS